MKRPSARVGDDGVMPEISRSARGADTRNRILHAARDVLAEYGMEGFTTRRVSARAQISHGMCHYHFRDKSDLVRALVEHARDDWITPLETMVKGPGTAESRARAVIDWMAEPATMEVLRVHLTLQWFALQDESVRNELAAEYARWRRGFAELFADLSTERGLRGLDIQLVGEAFASAADGLVHQQSLDPELDTKGVLTALFEKVAEIDMDAQSSPEELKRSGSAARASSKSA